MPKRTRPLKFARDKIAAMNAIDWLLDSDPAIRWQTLRDLTDAAPTAVAAERARVAREGLGAEILARQGADGAWHRDGEPDWLPTLFTMQLLRATGVDPADPGVAAAVARLQAGFRWHESFGAKPFFDGEVEPCINGGALALGAYFGRPSESLARRLVGEQLEDGGWNCDAPKSVRSSYHTTICVLEGLLEYERAVGSVAGDRGGKKTRRGVSARARSLPAALDRRGRAPIVSDVRVPAPLRLRRPPRARLLQGRRCQPDARIERCPARRQEQAAARRPMAPRSRARRGARASLRSASRWASRAGGTRSGRCACCVGTKADGEPSEAHASGARRDDCHGLGRAGGGRSATAPDRMATSSSSWTPTHR